MNTLNITLSIFLTIIQYLSQITVKCHLQLVENSDQPAYPSNLIRVFAAGIEKLSVLRQ